MIVIKNPDRPRKFGLANALFVILLLLICFWIIGSIMGSHRPEAATDARPATVVPTRAVDHIVLIAQGQRSSSGILWSISGSLENTGDRPIWDVEVECTTFGNSGTAIREATKTVYETAPAKGRVRFRNVEMGFWPDQARTYSCRAVRARW